MTGFNHGLTGAIIALTVQQPALAIPLSFISHFVQDAIPHYGNDRTKLFGRGFNSYLMADFLLALFLMILFGFWFPAEKWLIWACMIAAACPDLMWGYYLLYLSHIKKRAVRLGPLAGLHKKLQWSQTPKGIVIEVIWFVGAMLIIWNLR